MKRVPLPKPEKVIKVGLKRKKGYLHFIDKDGDISRVKIIAR